MSKNTLVTINTCKYEVSNEEFATALNTIISAETMGKQSAWVIATAYANIIENNLFEDDFENAKEFAGVMGVSQATITQYKKAVEFITANEVFTANDLSVGKAYMLSALKEQLNEFLTWCLSNDMLIETMTDGVLKKAIKEWKKENEAIESESEEVTEETTEETTEEESSLYDELISYIDGMSDDELVKVIEFVKGMRS